MPVGTGLGAWLRIVQSSTLLPMEPVINWDPTVSFQTVVVVEALRSFPQFDYVAAITSQLASYIMTKVILFFLKGIFGNL